MRLCLLGDERNNQARSISQQRHKVKVPKGVKIGLRHVALDLDPVTPRINDAILDAIEQNTPRKDRMQISRKATLHRQDQQLRNSFLNVEAAERFRSIRKAYSANAYLRVILLRAISYKPFH